MRLGSGNVRAIIDQDQTDHPSTSPTSNQDYVPRDHLDVVGRAGSPSPSPSVKGSSTPVHGQVSASGSIININQAKERELHASPSVAHSLLCGMQEDWSGLDDNATAEVLRKLDGIQGRSAKARGSIRLPSSSSNYSRPNSPGSVVRSAAKDETRSTPDRFQRMNEGWTTAGVTPARTAKDVQRTDVNGTAIRDAHVMSDRRRSTEASPVHGKRSSLDGLSDDMWVSLVLHDSDVKKPSNLRSSFTYNRGSASSTNYTMTLTSSRDSTSLSTDTNAMSTLRRIRPLLLKQDSTQRCWK